MMEDRSGTLWAGTSNGLFSIQNRNGLQLSQVRSYRPFPKTEENHVKNFAWKTMEGRDGKRWVVFSAHLCEFDPKTSVFHCYPYWEGDPGSEFINQFPTAFQDRNGFIWIGYVRGLLRFDPMKKTFLTYKNEPDNPASLSHNSVKSIIEDPVEPERYLWIGTGGGGLNRFDNTTGTFQRFTEKNGAPDMVFYGILPDAEGNLWMSTNKGLTVFSPQTLSFRNFDQNDGLQDLEFNTASSFLSADGQMFFGGINGINAFYPEEMLKANSHVPSVVFTDFRISGKPVSVRDSLQILEKAIPYTRELVLNYADKIISFEFAALDFAEPSKNKFLCKMEGFDQEWQALNTNNTATYTNLDPGQYTFRVKGANNDGLWDETGTSIKIQILSPWWMKWWAWLMYGLIVFSVVYAFFRLLIRRNREMAEARRLKELNESKSIFLSTVSHELRTPLTSILGFSKIIKKRLDERILPNTVATDPKTRRAVQQVMDNLDIVVKESERLTVLINEVLDLAKIEAGKTNWNMEQVSVSQIVRRAAEATEGLFEGKNLQLVQNIGPDLPDLVADRDRLIQVLVNLISNAVKFTDQGTVTISSWQYGREIVVSVADTGVGISEKDQLQVFEKFKQVGDDTLTGKPQGTGLGLPICKEIIEHHGGRIWVESEVGKGSVFSFALPLH